MKVTVEATSLITLNQSIKIGEHVEGEYTGDSLILWWIDTGERVVLNDSAMDDLFDVLINLRLQRAHQRTG